MEGLDPHLFQIINQEATHPWLDAFMPFWTDLHKNIFAVLPISAIVVHWAWRNFKMRGVMVLVGALAASALADFLNSNVLKPYFNHPRPSASNLPFAVISRGIVYSGPSFPSSHALSFFCFAGFICFFRRSLIPICLTLGILTCYSRIYCGDHFPSDVMAGAAIGAALGTGIAGAAKFAFARFARQF